jgi:hypothetical protein
MAPAGLYDVHTSLDEDKNEGSVCIRNTGLKKDLDGQRRIIRVTAGTGKSIFCEALYADHWYMEKWTARWTTRHLTIPPADENLAFISSWYRIRLGIGMRHQELEIEYRETSPRPFWWQVRACTDHPQVIVRLATLLAIIGLGLGILALGLGVAGVREWQPWGFWIGWSLAVSGVLVVVIGLFLGSRR